MNAPSAVAATSIIGSYFAPPPYIREAAGERLWGDSGVVVARPAPLADRAFFHHARIQCATPLGDVGLHYASLLTARISRVHGIPINARYKVKASADDKMRASVSRLLVRPAQTGQAFITAVATEAGVPAPRLRSDQAWVGGKSPLEASLALPDTAHLKDQLTDLMAFLYAHQADASEEVAEAMAYQLLTVHPLADGNGRTARTLLIKLACRTGAAYPLYFAWRLMFDQQRTASNWVALASTGKPHPDPRHHDDWLDAASALTTCCRSAIASGVDRRAVDALLLYGQVTYETIDCANNGCSPTLTRKILARLSSAVHQEALYRLEQEVGRAVEALRSAVTR